MLAILQIQYKETAEKCLEIEHGWAFIVIFVGVRPCSEMLFLSIFKAVDALKSIHGFFLARIFWVVEMNIVLVGYRCSGKSVVGKTLAKHLGLKLVDTDQILEGRVGCTIGQYVSKNGWESFRMVEKMIVRSVSSEDQQVIATGGGVVLDWENVRHLRQSGWMVFLQAGVSTIYERMMQDERVGRVRPGLVEKNPLVEIELVLKQRKALYHRACDLVVNTDQKNPEKLSAEIIQFMSEGLTPLRGRDPLRGMVPMSASNP